MEWMLNGTWMLNETTISQVEVWNHPIETTKIVEQTFQFVCGPSNALSHHNEVIDLATLGTLTPAVKKPEAADETRNQMGKKTWKPRQPLSVVSNYPTVVKFLYPLIKPHFLGESS